jgi:predicted PurR-regulated permease PerM
MDIFVTVGAGIIAAILAALVAIFRKKGIGKILVYALLGFVIGLLIGYILAPFILSFY